MSSEYGFDYTSAYNHDYPYPPCNEESTFSDSAHISNERMVVIFFRKSVLMKVFNNCYKLPFQFFSNHEMRYEPSISSYVSDPHDQFHDGSTIWYNDYPHESEQPAQVLATRVEIIMP